MPGRRAEAQRGVHVSGGVEGLPWAARDARAASPPLGPCSTGRSVGLYVFTAAVFPIFLHAASYRPLLYHTGLFPFAPLAGVHLFTTFSHSLSLLC